MVREKNKNPIKSMPEPPNLVPMPVRTKEPTQLDSTSSSVEQSKSGQKLMDLSKLGLNSKTTVQDFLETLRKEGIAAETVRMHSLLVESDMKEGHTSWTDSSRTLSKSTKTGVKPTSHSVRKDQGRRQNHTNSVKSKNRKTVCLVETPQLLLVPLHLQKKTSKQPTQNRI